MTIERATSILDKDFSAFDTAAVGGEGDGKIGQSDLKVVAENTDQKYSDEQVAAAQFLLDSNASRNFLELQQRRTVRIRLVRIPLIVGHCKSCSLLSFSIRANRGQRTHAITVGLARARNTLV